jgi:phosphoribosylformylglycinamidine synthase
MLSESQERMLLVVRKGREAEVERIFEKWDLHAVRIGEVTGDGLLRVRDRGQVVAELPNRALADQAPIYDRPQQTPAYLAPAQSLDIESLKPRQSPTRSLLDLLGAPTIASKRWVYRQYDHMVRTNTVVLPGSGSGVVRIKGTDRALAMSVDGNGRYCYLDPCLGAQLAVAEAARNVACAGALPIGATNNLNFGNPEKPEVMWQFAEAVRGIGMACRALDIPITGGNVSLYNETDGQPILPTPVLGVVGVIEDATCALGRAFRAAGSAIVLLGGWETTLGGSEYLYSLHGLLRGRPPALDLEAEQRLQRFLVAAAAHHEVASAHDCSEGGLAVALAECSFGTGGMGFDVDLPAPAVDLALASEIALFGEAPSRVVVSVDGRHVETFVTKAEAAGIPARWIGTTGGHRIRMSVGGRVAIDVDVAEAERAWDNGLERYFARQVA